jgi:arabinofuranosyltransferase
MALTSAAVARPSVRALAALALVALGLAHLRYHAGYTLDDAYITFRYARNFVRGAGLVYNPGDYVKGYSNTLFTLLMALPEWFGRDPIGFSRVIGVASFLGLGFLAYRSHVTHVPLDASSARRDRSHWLLALFAASTALAVHFSGGLETASYTLFVFAAVLRRVHEQTSTARPWSALLFCLVIWSRPEGVLIFAASALHDLAWRARSRRFRLQDLVFYLLPPLAYAGELAASLAYYGAAFPQTYYAKARETAGVFDALRTLWAGARAQLVPESYVSRGLNDAGFGWLGLCLTPLALLEADSRRRNAALLLALAAQLVFVVRAGDDWAPAFRFGVPLLPLWFALLVDAGAVVAKLARRYERLAFNLLGAVALAVCLPIQLRESERIAVERPVNAENKLAQGQWFATLARPGITLASFDIGGQGYAAGGFEILDCVGLTVRETTGCRDRLLPRCVTYAKLALPELVRLHNNRKRDAFVSRSVVAEQPYLALDGGKYLLARALVLPAMLPAELQARAPVSGGGAVLAGHDLPAAVRPKRRLQVALYWQRAAAARAALANRKLRWRSESGDRSAQASESILRHLAAAEAIGDEMLLEDLVTLETPHAPGRYELQAVVGNAALSLGTVDCLADPAARETAGRWLAQARANTSDPRVALELRARAAELSETAIDEYQDAAVNLASAARREAEELASREPVPALRIAQQAKRELVRALWQSGSATGKLRQELDANGEFRQRLIEAELTPQR